MSSAPPGDHLAPVIPNLSSMTNLHDPSIIPVAIGHPLARAWSYFMCWRVFSRQVTALAPSARSRARLAGLARGLLLAAASGAGAGLARPPRERRRRPPAHL